MNEAFERGVAVGVQQIRTDSVYFRFKGETWEFPSYEVVPHIAKYNGSYYEAPVKNLRKLKG